jgi:hypothetical protein
VVITPGHLGTAKGKDKATSRLNSSIDPAKLTAGVAYSTGPYDA